MITDIGGVAVVTEVQEIDMRISESENLSGTFKVLFTDVYGETWASSAITVQTHGVGDGGGTFTRTQEYDFRHYILS